MKRLTDGELDVLREMERDARESEEWEPPDCSFCGGSGEGMTDGECCPVCKGTGVDFGRNNNESA